MNGFERRQFLKGACASAAFLAFGGRSGRTGLSADSSPQDALVFDAMGELRNVYGPELLGQMLASGLNAITVTICDPKTWGPGAMQAAVDGVYEHDAYIKANPDHLLKASNVSDVIGARKEGKLAVFYLFQNSTQFGKDLTRVQAFYNLGVRSSQLTYNHQNWVGAGCKERTGAGLTLFGQSLVEEMNKVGMLIDLSHASMKTMADAIKASKEPVIVSHTGCMAVHPNVRNTTDENMKLLADHGGVVGICQIRPFISSKRKGAFEQYLTHIVRAIKVAGVEHVGIGSDRDHRVIEMSDEYIAELKAEEGPNFRVEDWPLYMDELNGPRRMEVVWDGLQRKGLSDRDLELVMGENVLRVYREAVG